MGKKSAKRKEFEAQVLPQLENLYRTALYVVDNESDAQNIVRESFVRAYKAWDTCRFIPECRVWLFGTLADIIINDYWPSLSMPVGVTGVDEIDESLKCSRLSNHGQSFDSNPIPCSAVSESDIKNAFKSLPHDFRLIAVLSLLEGFSYKEIVEIVGFNLETVRSKLHKGRKLMQKELFDHVGYEDNYAVDSGRVRMKNRIDYQRVRYLDN